MSDIAENYLLDLGALLKEAALDAKTGATSKTGTSADQFALGRATAYYEVISLMEQQAKTFGLDPKMISLDGFDADKDLL